MTSHWRICTSGRAFHRTGCRGGLATSRRAGFTLIELLVVILIIMLVSAVALPTVLPAINHRQVSEAARILQGALVGARDKAIHDGRPSGIRLLPDPIFFRGSLTLPNGQTVPVPLRDSLNQIAAHETLAYSRVVPIDPAPEYSEGFCTPYTQGVITRLGNTLTNVPPGLGIVTFPNSVSYPMGLVLMEAPVDPKTNAPNPPTSWYWNVRVGDRIQIGNSGPWYTIVGPMVIGPQGDTISGTFYANSELFVNVGPPAPIGTYRNIVPSIGGQSVEYLVLVNGLDDNNNGWVDEGQDGVDNDGLNGPDDRFEWEHEEWVGFLNNSSEVNLPYTIQRRPAPSPNAREIALPSSMIIDATTLFLDKERSRLPINVLTRYSGYIDIVVNPDGTVLPTTTYSSPSSFAMDQAYYHFWLAERQDLASVQADAQGNPLPLTTGAPYYLPIAQPGGSNPNNYPGPYLKGDYTVLTLFTRTGQIVVNANPPFLNSSGTYNATNPFIPAEQGVSGGP